MYQNQKQMKIELKKISFSERMSQETNCFVADLYIDGKKVGQCNNDGHGGCTNYHGSTIADLDIIKKAEAYCKSLPKVKYGDMEWEQSLEGVIDDLLTEFLVAKEAKKREKMYLKAFCFGVPKSSSYRTVYWKGRTLAQIDKVNLQRAYDKVKSELKTGEVIFNTNLKELGLV
jgi:hypothetical protein